MNEKMLQSTIVNENGDSLWFVHFASYSKKDDAFVPEIVPVNERLLVVAKSKTEAKKKTKKEISELKKRCKGFKALIRATLISMDSLVVAGHYSLDGRIHSIATNKFMPVTLSCEEDRKRYRLGVSLIPLQ